MAWTAPNIKVKHSAADQTRGVACRRRFDYNNMVQPTGYLLAKLDPSRKEEYSRPIRDVMALWLNAQSNITYTPKVRS
jgi:hypothetical protein